ncbi:electron transfer flavoprotein subunit alpha/FixB family protein [Zobellella denitrificans]|jgi:electron transfer flavoprotein alpha subunit
MAILVIAEHNHRRLGEATLNTLAAARELGDDLQVLVAGADCREAAEAAAGIPGVTRVLLADAPWHRHPLPENLAPLVAGLAGDYSHLLAPASANGKNLMPRVAALLGVDPVSDITAVLDAETYQRPIYAGNAIATVRSNAAVKVITVRASAFEPVAAEGGKAPITAIDSPADSGLSRVIGEALSRSERPELGAARVVVAGGRGLQSRDHFELLYRLADKLGAAVGASRAAVDAGMVANDLQVGQTGKIVAPRLYIAVGISGAIQHLAGMKDSGVIVAINKDEEAPIFQVADYGLVGDLFEILPELERLL